MTFRNEHAILSQDDVADTLGCVRQSVSESEQRAMKKMRELFDEDDFPDTERCVVMGRWNGQKLVRVR